ncbi:MAG: hypothetical protein EB015_19765 [Methylocystaceae bacterium]|nr:hypothetical protein [Methylocystaceae bacterium]
MMKNNKNIFVFIAVAGSLAGCANGPSQAQLEYQAFDRVISEKVAKGQMSAADGELARQQYVGNLRTREANIAASHGVASSNNAYASNSGMALGMALMCAGQRGGHC